MSLSQQEIADVVDCRYGEIEKVLLKIKDAIL
jgi:hypothetical protein